MRDFNGFLGGLWMVVLFASGVVCGSHGWNGRKLFGFVSISSASYSIIIINKLVSY